MANETIGTVICPFCNEEGEVRKDKRGKLYYLSPAGMIKPNLQCGQDWLLNNAKMYGPEGAPEPAAPEPIQIQPETPTTPAPVEEEITLEPPPKKSAIEEWLP